MLWCMRADTKGYMHARTHVSTSTTYFRHMYDHVCANGGQHLHVCARVPSGGNNVCVKDMQRDTAPDPEAATGAAHDDDMTMDELAHQEAELKASLAAAFGVPLEQLTFSAASAGSLVPTVMITALATSQCDGLRRRAAARAGAFV